jgi:hypothetical protein
MVNPLIVSVGMPRAGSGWFFNLTHDLVVASGGKDARLIRKRFFLHPILTEVNCNIGALTLKRLVPVMVPALLGHKFVIKAHANPSPIALRWIRTGKLRVSYIYRDPRDALLSAYEYGLRKRASGRNGVFADLKTIEDAIRFIDEYVHIAELWLSRSEVLHTRYEDLLQNYQTEVERLAVFYDIAVSNIELHSVIDRYHPHQGSQDQVGTHFVKGKIGRYRQKLSKKQQDFCIERFGGFLERMGYPVP